MTLGIRKITRVVELAKSAFWRYRWQIALISAFSLFGGALEAVGINAVIPIFSVIDGGVPADPISKAISSSFSYFGLPYTVKFLMILMASMFMAKTVFMFISRQINIKIAADYEEDARRELFGLMLLSDWPYLSAEKAGHLEQTLITDTERSSALLTHIGGSVLIAVNLVVYSLLALNISFVIAMLAFALGGVLLLFFKPLFYKNRMASVEMAQKYKDVAHYTSEMVSGMKVVKSFLAEDPVLHKASDYFSRMKELRLRVGFMRILSEVLVQPVAALFILAIFAFFYKTESLHLASFAVIIYAVNRVFSNIQAAHGEIHVLNSLVPHTMSIMRHKEESIRHKEKSIGKNPFKFNEVLEFNDVSFSYPSSGQTLSHISFSITKGSMVGVIGPSGSGKSTLVDLLLCLQTPNNGVILADGEDVSSIRLREWRRNISYVPQEPFLMNDTIYNNIIFFNQSLTADDVNRAAKTANIYDFIQSLPKGFETVVGERGLRLSGGERQRVVLARALARRPQILILDEATSALDNESELLIQKAIEQLKGQMTIIVVAHRLSTVENSDQLIVLESGTIRETGAPAELLGNKQSYFFNAYNLRR